MAVPITGVWEFLRFEKSLRWFRSIRISRVAYVRSRGHCRRREQTRKRRCRRRRGGHTRTSYDIYDPRVDRGNRLYRTTALIGPTQSNNLGMLIDKKLNFSRQANFAANKAKAARAILYPAIDVKGLFPNPHVYRAYHQVNTYLRNSRTDSQSIKGQL